MHIMTVVGARPQFIKAATVSREVARRAEAGQTIAESIVHTGQHYDENMSRVFFDELAIPRPLVNLEVGSGPHGRMTGLMLAGIEERIVEVRPDVLLVYGDTDSTLAGALAAAKLHVPVAHVEAGLRSYNRLMPEEINRELTDRLSRWLFCPTDLASGNLRAEAVTDGVHVVGDVMYDAFQFYRDEARRRSTVVADHGLTGQAFALATIHRAGNTDDPARLADIFAGLGRLAERLPVVLPLHPRTRKAIEGHGLGRLVEAPGLRALDPVGYLDMQQLEGEAALVVTDSGGVQKEAYFHRTPCLTMRDESEWTETVESGWNVLCGSSGEKLAAEADRFLDRADDPPHPDFYGDGRAAEKIVDRLVNDMP